MSTWFQNRQKQSLLVLALLMAGLVYVSYCGGPPSAPRERVSAIVDELVSAAEKKNLGPFKKHLSEEIRDESGRGKKELLDLLRLIFLRHSKISLTVLSKQVEENTNPSIFDVSLSLLMSESLLPTDRGEFFLTFRKEGDAWRIWALKWGEGYGFE